MINKITERKCKYCDTIISYIPRKVRCLDCHEKFLDNAMITSKNTKKSELSKQDELLKSLDRNMNALIDSISKQKYN